MMVSLETLTKKIEQQLNSKAQVVVAISGFGGAGKTTLADKLISHFPQAASLSLDDFVTNRGLGSGWDGGFDWQRLEGLFKDIKAGKDLHYQRYDWKTDALDSVWISKKLPQLLIIEGVRIFQPRFMPYFDLSVWIDTDLAQATAQGIARDRQKWVSVDKDGLEAHLENWHKVWAPKEQEFLDKFHPDKTADLTIKIT